MKKLILSLLIIVCFTSNFLNAQGPNPESFFPHHVGDRWQYADDQGTISKRNMVKDSLDSDGSIYIFYNISNSPRFKIDTSMNVFENPSDPFVNYLRYKLDANIGDVWENPGSGSQHWAWVARIESSYIFSKSTIVRVYRYGPSYPDSANSSGIGEEWLASGFGLIYEQNDVSFNYLIGCVIAGDTSGFITSVKDIENKVVTAFQMNQNYPNPFNPSTSIGYSLPRDSQVRISIYNILGEQIAILYDGYKPAGNYQVIWNAEDFSSGIYFCQIQYEGNIKTIKMILTK